MAELADAVEWAMGSLDPGFCDLMGPGGVAVDGGGGVDAATMVHLAGLTFALLETAGWLSPDQQLRAPGRA
ncbi:hypothetical protein [Streptomyces sp. NPDC055107]